MQHKRQTTTSPSPQAERVPLRGPKSGHLYGMLDPKTLTIEVKRKGGETETIDLRACLAEPLAAT